MGVNCYEKMVHETRRHRKKYTCRKLYNILRYSLKNKTNESYNMDKIQFWFLYFVQQFIITVT